MKDDFIPSSQCKILWNRSDLGPYGLGLVTKVIVTRKGQAETEEEKAMRSSWGAVFSDWESGDDARMTTAGTFGLMLHHGFASHEVMRQALEQLAKIDSAAWAREMLAGMDYVASWPPEDEPES